MRLGSFWGMTAPMFVLAFQEREEPIAIFNAMLAHSEVECLQSLRKELLYLTRLERLVEYRCDLSTESITSDDFWDDGLREHPECSGIFRNEVLQRVLVKCSERERAGKCKDLDAIEECIAKQLKSWKGKVSDVAKVVAEIMRALPSSDDSSVNAWAAKHEIVLSSSLAESVVVGGKKRILSEEEKRVVEYFLSRMPDVRFWVEELNVQKEKQQEVFGLPFFQLAKRKPESIRYVVLSQFDQIKSMNNAKVLLDTVDSIRKDVHKFRELYEKFVSTEERTGSGSVVQYQTNDFFGILSLRGFDMSVLAEDDQALLWQLYECCCRVSPSNLEKIFGFGVENWSAFGESLVELGICGLNGFQLELFAEAIVNTVLSTNKLFVEKEKQESVKRILEYDVDAMLDTIMPVGRVLYE